MLSSVYQQYWRAIYPSMRSSNQSSTDKQWLMRPSSISVDIENEYSFDCNCYQFPNDLTITRSCKSFKTIIEASQFDKNEQYTKKLSNLNRSQHVIKLKQIKREETQYDQLYNHKSRYLLYYEAIPFSMEHVKDKQVNLPISATRMDKILKEVASDLIQFNIYCEIGISQCGFNENGEFRVFIPPLNVLKQNKLSATDKLKIHSAAASVLKYWQSQKQRIINNSPVQQPTRRSYRYNSPQMKQMKRQSEQEESRGNKNSQQDNIDIKKTIKLSKNYVKELNQKINDDLIKNQKKCQLKKHRSLGLILKDDEQEPKTASSFLSKIDELNKKLINIREAFISKKSTDHPREILDNFISREKEQHKVSPIKMNQVAKEQQDYEEVIFQKKNSRIEAVPQKNKGILEEKLDFDRVSVDTYLDEIGNQYKMPNFKPSSQLRKTTLPTQLLPLKQALQGKTNNWFHQSAGNLVFKRFIQKTREGCPQMTVGQKEANSSEISLVREGRKSAKNKKQERSPLRVKKMVSLDTFESQVQTKSIDLSQVSNDVSNVKKKKDKLDKNRNMKQKISDILMKSKKAIQLLKNPVRKVKK